MNPDDDILLESSVDQMIDMIVQEQAGQEDEPQASLRWMRERAEDTIAVLIPISMIEDLCSTAIA